MKHISKFMTNPQPISPATSSVSDGSARERGLLAGHKCYEGNCYKENPYPKETDEWGQWMDAFSEAYDSAEENDD